MAWSPSTGLYVKERGWWVRIMNANHVRLIDDLSVNPLPADAQTVWVADEPWLQEAVRTREGQPGGQ